MQITVATPVAGLPLAERSLERIEFHREDSSSSTTAGERCRRLRKIHFLCSALCRSAPNSIPPVNAEINSTSSAETGAFDVCRNSAARRRFCSSRNLDLWQRLALMDFLKPQFMLHRVGPGQEFPFGANGFVIPPRGFDTSSR